TCRGAERWREGMPNVRDPEGISSCSIEHLVTIPGQKGDADTRPLRSASARWQFGDAGDRCSIVAAMISSNTWSTWASVIGGDVSKGTLRIFDPSCPPNQSEDRFDFMLDRSFARESFVDSC